MKTVLLSSLLACGLLLTATSHAQEVAAPAVDPAAEQAAQLQTAYGLFCTPDAELTQEQIDILANDEQSLNSRTGFQTFVNDPKAALNGILVAFKGLEEQAKAILADPKNAEQLNQLIADYAKQMNLSTEEATKAVMDFQIAALVQQQAGSDVVGAIVNATLQSCQTLEYIKPLIEKSGCKNAETAAAIDFTVTNQLCSEVAPKIVEMGGYQQEVARIQADLQEYMAALQQTAQAKAQPYMAEMDKTATSIFDLVVGFVGEQPAVQVPLATTP